MHYHNYYEILLTATALLVGIEAKPRIHFSDITGELKILVFSDLHYGEAADKDLRSYVGFIHHSPSPQRVQFPQI